MRKWILWIPVLMVGSMIYWTIALNFGGLSLLALSTYAVPGSAMDDLNDLRDSYQPITVNVAGAADDPARSDSDDESVDVEVISDRDRDTARSDQRGAGDRNGRTDTGPGETAY